MLIFPGCVHSIYVFKIAANITLMVCGTMFGWTSPSLPKLMSPDSPIPITQNEATWIASLSAIGSMLGPFPAGNNPYL